MRTLKFDKPNVKPTFTIKKLTEEEKAEVNKEPEEPTVHFKGGNKRSGRASRARQTQGHKGYRSAFPDGFYSSNGSDESSEHTERDAGTRVRGASDSDSGGERRSTALAKADKLFAPKESSPVQVDGSKGSRSERVIALYEGDVNKIAGLLVQAWDELDKVDERIEKMREENVRLWELHRDDSE